MGCQMFYILTFSLFFSPSEPFCVWPAKPKKDSTLIAEKSLLSANQKSFDLKIRFVPPGEFGLLCLEKGIPGSLLQNKTLQRARAFWMSFELFITNFSSETLFLNPGHMVIRKDHEPVGILLEPGVFFSQENPESMESLLPLVHIFNTTTIEVLPGKTLHRVLTFRILEDAISNHSIFDLCIDHLYLGIEDFPLKGQISIQPCNIP